MSKEVGAGGRFDIFLDSALDVYWRLYYIICIEGATSKLLKLGGDCD